MLRRHDDIAHSREHAASRLRLEDWHRVKYKFAKIGCSVDCQQQCRCCQRSDDCWKSYYPSHSIPLHDENLDRPTTLLCFTNFPYFFFACCVCCFALSPSQKLSLLLGITRARKLRCCTTFFFQERKTSELNHLKEKWDESNWCWLCAAAGASERLISKINFYDARAVMKVNLFRYMSTTMSLSREIRWQQESDSNVNYVN